MISDFNSVVNQSCMKAFCESFNLSSLIKEPTCYKNPQNPSCMNLVLTKTPYSLQSSCVIETGLPDFHKMTVTVMKTTYKKLKLRTVKISVMTHFEKFFWRNWLRKILIETVMVLRNFYKFALTHWTHLFFVIKNRHEEMICFSGINP